MKILYLFILSLFTYSMTVCGQTSEEYYEKAFEFYDKKEYDKALEIIEKSLVSKPANGPYLLLKGNILHRQEKLQEAFDVYSLAIKANPEYSLAYNQRGLLLMKIQKFEYSIRDFTTALGFEPKDSIRLSLLLNRGAAKQSIRDFQGAYDDFVIALKFDSLNVGLLNNLSAVCDEIGKGDQTLGYLYKILQIDSTFVGAYENLGFKFQEMGDHKTAVDYFNKALAMSPDEPLAYSNRAFNKYKLGELKSALSDINISIKLYPANSYAFRTRALIYLALKKNREACEDIKNSLELGFTKMYGEEVEKLKKQHCDTEKAQVKTPTDTGLAINP